jgi:uncharacterized membrane protein YdfJ with MMPL/SSD domain
MITTKQTAEAFHESGSPNHIPPQALTQDEFRKAAVVFVSPDGHAARYLIQTDLNSFSTTALNRVNAITRTGHEAQPTRRLLLDTFLVHTIVVPTIAVLVGRPNWWPSRVGATMETRTRRLGQQKYFDGGDKTRAILSPAGRTEFATVHRCPVHGIRRGSLSCLRPLVRRRGPC